MPTAKLIGSFRYENWATMILICLNTAISSGRLLIEEIAGGVIADYKASNAPLSPFDHDSGAKPDLLCRGVSSNRVNTLF